MIYKLFRCFTTEHRKEVSYNAGTELLGNNLWNNVSLLWNNYGKRLLKIQKFTFFKHLSGFFPPDKGRQKRCTLQMLLRTRIVLSWTNTISTFFEKNPLYQDLRKTFCAFSDHKRRQIRCTSSPSCLSRGEQRSIMLKKKKLYQQQSDPHAHFCVIATVY